MTLVHTLSIPMHTRIVGARLQRILLIPTTKQTTPLPRECIACPTSELEVLQNQNSSLNNPTNLPHATHNRLQTHVPLQTDVAPF